MLTEYKLKYKRLVYCQYTADIRKARVKRFEQKRFVREKLEIFPVHSHKLIDGKKYMQVYTVRFY